MRFYSKNLAGPRMEVQASIVIIRDGLGKMVEVTNSRYGPQLIERGVTSGSLGLSEALASLPSGSYQAVWRVNEWSSNVVNFEIDPYEPSGHQPALIIEPVVQDERGVEDEGEFLVFFRNDTEESISIAGAWARSRVFIDGKEYKLHTIGWAGRADLWPSESWSRIVSLASFISEDRKPVEAGEHEVQYQLGGHLSAPIPLKVSRRTCLGPVWPNQRPVERKR